MARNAHTKSTASDDAHHLKLLDPDSKFLFLIRFSYDVYRSWAARRNAGWKWLFRWPDQPVTLTNEPLSAYLRENYYAALNNVN